MNIKDMKDERPKPPKQLELPLVLPSNQKPDAHLGAVERS